MDRTPASSAVFSEIFGSVPVRHRLIEGLGLHKQAIALIGAIAMMSAASPAMAGSEMSAKLVNCGAQSCLQVSGHRDDPASIVIINGQAVSAEGKHGWRVRLPVETVRQLSAPYARSIEVSLRNQETQFETFDSVDLPIGLLGNVTELASLDISAR